MVHASVLGQAQIRSGLLLLALLDREERRALLLNSASSLLRIPHEALQANLLEWIQASREQPAAPNRPAAGGDKPESAQDPLLDQYTQDLTAEARAGRIDPIVGRDRRSASASTSSCAGGRTTRSWSARRASARPRWSRAWPCASPPARCRRRCRR
ncbi:hypothetical protein P4233_20295 [Pseudomonas aeruginosa]|nr:hypothetical protein [Pseudomonas aeruginosa]